jgi:hypothetical protein
MTIIGFIIAVIYIIWLNNIISFGFKTATRIAKASEATAANMALLIKMIEARQVSQMGYEAVERELNNE